MGMFDTIRFFGAPALACAEGHEIRELQTKDLENALSEYVVAEGRLYRSSRTAKDTVQAEAEGRLTIVARRFAEPVSLTSELVAYSSCDECLPILYLADTGGRGPWSDYVQERSPWCEWRLVFAGGRLERCVVERLDSRNAVRSTLLAQGLDVLDDDDRLARLHFQRRTRQEED